MERAHEISMAVRSPRVLIIYNCIAHEGHALDVTRVLKELPAPRRRCRQGVAL